MGISIPNIRERPVGGTMMSYSCVTVTTRADRETISSNEEFSQSFSCHCRTDVLDPELQSLTNLTFILEPRLMFWLFRHSNMSLNIALYFKRIFKFEMEVLNSSLLGSANSMESFVLYMQRPRQKSWLSGCASSDNTVRGTSSLHTFQQGINSSVILRNISADSIIQATQKCRKKENCAQFK